VAKAEDDFPSFDSLNLGDEPAEIEPAGEPEVVEVSEAEPIASVTPVEEVPQAEQPAEEPEEPETEFEKPSQLPVVLPVAAAVGVPVIALVLAFTGLLFISTAVYLIALGYIGLALWVGRRTNTVYVVILACVVAAILTGVFCLWRGLGNTSST